MNIIYVQLYIYSLSESCPVIDPFDRMNPTVGLLYCFYNSFFFYTSYLQCRGFILCINLQIVLDIFLLLSVMAMN